MSLTHTGSNPLAENKVFDNATFHCTGTGRMIGGQTNRSGYCKFLDPDGDFVVVEFSYSGARKEGRATYRALVIQHLCEITRMCISNSSIPGTDYLTMTHNRKGNR